VSPKSYSTYEKIRKRSKNRAVAEVVDGCCGACHLTLRLQFFQDLRRGDQIMLCENCSRILYYNPPVEYDEMGPQGSTETHPLETGR
jgi:predicted  nucleic acid-binding Zn-ribbon protein